MKKLTNLIIVDASGSMQNKTSDVIGGLKQILTQIKEDAIRDLPTVTTNTIVTEFSSSGVFKVLTDSKDSTDIDPAEADRYRPGGGTALYDAIDKSFSLVKDEQDAVFVTIFTDGEENDSKEITHEVVKKLIEKKREEKWTITFMGTTEEDIKAAIRMGVSAGNTMYFQNSVEGAKMSMRKMSNMRNVHYTASMNPGVYSRSVDLNSLVEEDDLINNTTTISGNTILGTTTDAKPITVDVKIDKDDNGEADTNL